MNVAPSSPVTRGVSIPSAVRPERRNRWRGCVVVLFTTLVSLTLASCGGSAAPAADVSEGYDRAFLQAMVPHHVAAIEAARLAIDRAESPELRGLAQQMVTVQTAEIATMEAIHQRLFGGPLVPDPAAHEVLGLTAAEAGMDHLEAAAELGGADPFDPAFIDHMVPHHRGAIAMAETMLLESRTPEIRRLALEMYVAQQDEIEAMSAIRAEGFGGPAPEAVDEHEHEDGEPGHTH